jgi:predicted kinase
MANKGFTETRYDYSAGRDHAPELTVCVGISGSGKSTEVMQRVKRSQGKTVRLNRDKMREMLFCGADWNKHNENFVRTWQMEGARIALQSGKNVVIDDTNCIRNTRQKWEEFAVEQKVKLCFLVMDVPLKECVERDIARGVPCPTCGTPKGVMVGEEIIRRQYKDLTSFNMSNRDMTPTSPTRAWMERQALLKGGFVPRLVGRPWVLFDMDGTVADHRGQRNPYEEHKVTLDNCYEVVAEWIRQLAPSHNLCAVSGRHDFCGDLTCEWLEGYNVPFDHILMRYNGDNRPDVVVKQEILNELIAVIGKENIAFVLDDRPQVVKMWRANGIKVYPVRGEPIHRAGCSNGYAKPKEGVYIGGFCGECGALENF